MLENANDRPALEVTPVAPVLCEKRGDHYFVDFGKAAWGNIELSFDVVPASRIVVRVGEKLNAAGSIDREPPGSVNYREFEVHPVAGQLVYQLQIPSSWMHVEDTMAVHMPAEIGEVTPFRYAEIEGAPAGFDPSRLRQLFVHAAFDDDAASFDSSDDVLNAVWELCKYTMKATTAFGVYIDGERERIPYEADAYINQLSHLACDLNPAVARASIEHLLQYPTWPTEWSYHTIMMVLADYQYTGDTAFAARHYPALHEKLLMDRVGEGGLLRIGANIDWPPSERDGYNDGVIDPNDPNLAHPQLGPDINTVANAFYFHGLQCMATLAGALHNVEDERYYRAKAREVFEEFNRQCFDTSRGIYHDGANTHGVPVEHASLHANMFPLAFGLVPADRVKSVADFVESRGMICSVYGAQYMLEALYKAGRDEAALRMMNTRGKRGWWQMIEAGSTMTWEAWSEEVKPNLTWNHAWGAVPANILSRFTLGVRPLDAGFEQILIAPQPGSLQWANAKVPTPFGSVAIKFRSAAAFELEVVVPEGTTARVKWPRREDTSVYLNEVPVGIESQGHMVSQVLKPGRHTLRA